MTLQYVPSVGPALPEVAGGGAITPLSRTFIVDGTSTTAAPDGSIANPFLTIAAAMAAVALLAPGEPASILVGPGTYNEQVIWPERDRVALVGSGTGETIISAAGLGTSALEFAPGAVAGATINTMEVSDLTLEGDVGTPALRMISATFSPATTLSDGAFFERVNVDAPFNGGPGQAAFLSGLGNVYVADSFWATSVALGASGDEVTTVENCTTFFFSRGRLGDLHTGYDDAPGTTPGSGRSIYQIDNATQIETRWIISGHPICAAAPGTAVRGTSAIVPTIDASGLTTGATHSPQLFLAALTGNPVDPGSGNIVVTFPDQTAVPEPANLSLLGGTFLGTLLAEVAAGATRILVPAYGATFTTLAPGGITAGNAIDLDLRDAKYEEPTLAIVPLSSGAIDRSRIILVPAALVPGPNPPIPISPPLPVYRTSGYTIAFTDLAPAPGGAVAFPIATLLPGGFVPVAAAPAFGAFTVFVP